MIRLAGVTYGYRRDRAILSDWGMEVETGEVVAVQGESGRGKSTLLYLIGGLVRPWVGSIELAGTNIARMSDRHLSDLRATVVGFVFQDSLLDGRRSVVDNIAEGAIYRGLGASRARLEALRLMDSLGVLVEPGRKAVDLSGGQAQRIALCRALLNHPLVILADEPTGNLDFGNASLVEATLFDQARLGAAVVIATHDSSLASRCHRIVRV